MVSIWQNQLFDKVIAELYIHNERCFFYTYSTLQNVSAKFYMAQKLKYTLKYDNLFIIYLFSLKHLRFSYFEFKIRLIRLVPFFKNKKYPAVFESTTY